MEQNTEGQYIELALTYAKGWVFETRGKGGQHQRIGTSPAQLYARLEQLIGDGWELVAVCESAAVFGRSSAQGRLYSLIQKG